MRKYQNVLINNSVFAHKSDTNMVNTSLVALPKGYAKGSDRIFRTTMTPRNDILCHIFALVFSVKETNREEGLQQRNFTQ